MGKVTGIGVRAGKVKHLTPKVLNDGPRTKKTQGRAGKRKKVSQHTTDAQQNLSSNAQKKDKFGVFGSDHRPGLGDPNADLWDETLHNTRKTSSKQPSLDKQDRSHHQEQGKQWANFHEERDQKRAEQQPDRSDSCESYEESSESEAYESSEEEEGAKKDVDFITVIPASSEPAPGDNGFVFQEAFLDETEMAQILEHIAQGPWVNDREEKRVQIYGYNYLNPSLSSVPIPACFDQILKKLSPFGAFTELLISEFSPGIGVRPHVDRFFWDELVIGISLLSSCVFALESLPSTTSPPVTTSVTLTPGSLYLLKGSSRYSYSHSVVPESVKSTRISLTFRNLSTSKVQVPQETIDSLKIHVPSTQQ